MTASELTKAMALSSRTARDTIRAIITTEQFGIERVVDCLSEFVMVPKDELIAVLPKRMVGEGVNSFLARQMLMACFKAGEYLAHQEMNNDGAASGASSIGGIRESEIEAGS